MKSLTLALCVIAILGSAASTFFYFQIGNTKELLKQDVAKAEARSVDLQGKLAEAGAQGEALQKRLAALDSDLGEAKSKATAADTRNAQLSRDVAQLRNQITAKDDAEQTLNREVSQLKRELAQAKLSASAATPEEIEGYKSTIATLQAKITELESNRGSIAAMPNTTGAATAAATGTTGAAAGGNTAAAVSSPANLSGEVVSIGSQNAFVILNIGSAKGVQVGQKFNITRGGSTVAASQISSVQENYAIAQISGSVRGGLNKGDVAVIAQ